MRRIIERVVTVVTTTTWTISWKDDPLPSQPDTDPDPGSTSRLKLELRDQRSDMPEKEVEPSPIKK